MATPRPRKKLDADGLWNYSLRVLGNRAYSAYELRRKLVERAASPPDVESVMDKLKEYGLSDDGKFSEMFAASRLANEGFGRFRVLRDLQSKRVGSAVAEKAVAAAFAETDEQQLAEKFLVRKYRGKDLRLFLQEEKNLAAAYRRLRTAGFSSGVTMTALKKYKRELDEWDEPAEDSDK